MPLWGRNDQAVTANSTTTTMRSNGAPMFVAAMFSKGGGANAAFGNTSGTVAAAEVNAFGNVTPSAIANGMVVGVFGVDTTEIAVTNKGIAHAGWNVRKVGTGGIISFTYTGTATGYNNTDVVTFTSPVAGGNGSATIATNSTGGALTLTITNPGYGFFVANAAANVAVANSTGGATAGSGATFLATAGGRAGRVTWETLVAMGSLGAQSAPYGTPALVADASDDTTLADS